MKHSYGLITHKDAETIEHALTLVCLTFVSGEIKTTELGIHHGRTATGIHNYITHIRGRQHRHIGVDNEKDMPINVPFPGCVLLLGDSTVMAEMIPDNSQHFIFIDANHSFASTIADFNAYCDKVVRGGLIAFHDTSPKIPEFKDFQGGDSEDPNCYISCRKAVEYLGLLNSTQWQVVFDEYDNFSDTGGMICLKKMY